jgi:Cu-processing system ATP-binding protein
LVSADVVLAQQAVDHLSGVSSVVTAVGLRISCPRETKMAVLGAIAGLGAKLLDLTIQEPSLEDMFFKF